MIPSLFLSYFLQFQEEPSTFHSIQDTEAHQAQNTYWEKAARRHVAKYVILIKK